jgi:Mrp family chromosome partitioning ATPase
MYFVLTLSGKGGVGKTFVAINLAYKLAEKKGLCALIDGDIANPNAAELLGVKDQIQVSAQQFIPVKVGNIEFFSMQTISGERPVSMKADQYAQILSDVLKNTKWTSDVAIIDMPAGAHDELNELLTTFGENLLGSVIVLQPAHWRSAKKMLELHKSEGIPVIGLISNMSYFTCPFHEKPMIFKIFGDFNVEELCKEFDVPLLGEIPLSMEIRENIEKGNPILPPTLSKPVDLAVEKILEAKPVGASFVERLKEKLKSVARNTLIELIFRVVEIANTEIPIKQIQSEYGFPGGRVIELDITDEKLTKVNVRALFKLENGVLKIVKPRKDKPIIVDDEIRVWDKALIWSVIGRRTDTNMPFTLWDAWLTGKLQYYSNSGTGTQRTVQFLGSVLDKVSATESFKQLIPLCERIA